MSQTLHEKLEQLRAFAGIPSYDEQIEVLEDKLSTSDDVTKAEFTALNAEQDAEIDTKSDLVKGAAIINYFVGGPLANEANNGLSANTPKTKVEAILKEADLTKPLIIVLLGDVVLDEYFRQQVGSVNIQFTAPAGLLPKLSFAGVAQLSFGGSANLKFSELKIVNDKRSAAPSVVIEIGGGVVIGNCEIEHTVEADAAGASDIFFLNPFAQVRITSTIIGPLSTDKVFREYTSASLPSRLLSA